MVKITSKMKYQVSLSYEKTGKMIAQCMLIFMFLDSKRKKTKDSEPNGFMFFQNLICC